jgi:hypothetical protein
MARLRSLGACAIVVVLGAACARRIAEPPSIGVPSAASPAIQWRVTHVCDAKVDAVGAERRPRETADAVVSHRLDDGYAGRRLHFEVLRSGQASFYDDQHQRPGDEARAYCGSTSIGSSQMQKLEQTLFEHRFCSLKESTPDPHAPVHRLRARMPRVNCEITVTTRGMDANPDAAAVYRAITALEPRCPNDAWPCEVPGAAGPAPSPPPK